MTVEEKFRAIISGDLADIVSSKVIQHACESPLEATPRLRAVNTSDEYLENYEDADWFRGYEYALSTFYYSLSGMIIGGSTLEQVGDVRSSKTIRPLSDADRAFFRSMGDRLRKKLGYPIEESIRDEGGMFDATSLRNRN